MALFEPIFAALELDGWEAHRDMQIRAHLSTTAAQRL